MRKSNQSDWYITKIDIIIRRPEYLTNYVNCVPYVRKLIWYLKDEKKLQIKLLEKKITKSEMKNISDMINKRLYIIEEKILVNEDTVAEIVQNREEKIF